MAKAKKKTVRKAKRIASRRRSASSLQAVGTPWGAKEQALSWAIQANPNNPNARDIIAAAKLFEDYLSGGARGK